MYQFLSASRALETRTLAPNMKACYSIPSTNICPLSIRVIWPRSSPDLSCACPVYNSSAGGRAFEACQQSCPDSGYETMFVSNGSVCFVTSINQTIVHYECSSSICSSTGGECVAVVNTMLASHMILIAGKDNILSVAQSPLLSPRNNECNKTRCTLGSISTGTYN